MTDLFRSEAIDHARNRMGGPVNNFGLKSWILTGFMALALLTALVYASVGRYTKKETVLGIVVPADGVLNVVSAKSGIIREIFVKNGHVVKKGQRLFYVSYDVTLSDGGVLSERINYANSEQIRSATTQATMRVAQLREERSVLLTRRNDLAIEIENFQGQRDIQRQRVELLGQTVDSSRELHENKYMSSVQFRQREDSLLQARQSLMQVDQSIHRAQSQLHQLLAQIDGASAQIAAAEADEVLGRARMEEKRLNDLAIQGEVVVASRDGRVTNMNSRPGDAVSPGKNLAVIVPTENGQKQLAHLWAPSRSVGFLKEGDRVRLKFDAFPYQTFGVGMGQVLEVAKAPVMPNEIPVPIETREQMYKIVVVLDRNDLNAYGRAWPLTSGMRLTADLVLDERSLLEWLLDPLIAIRNQ